MALRARRESCVVAADAAVADVVLIDGAGCGFADSLPSSLPAFLSLLWLLFTVGGDFLVGTEGVGFVVNWKMWLWFDQPYMFLAST